MKLNLNRLFALTWFVTFLLLLIYASNSYEPNGREIRSPIYRMDGYENRTSRFRDVPTTNKLTKTTRTCLIIISKSETEIRIATGFTNQPGNLMIYQAVKHGENDFDLYQEGRIAGSLNLHSGTGVWLVRQHGIEKFYLVEE